MGSSNYQTTTCPGQVSIYNANNCAAASYGGTCAALSSSCSNCVSNINCFYVTNPSGSSWCDAGYYASPYSKYPTSWTVQSVGSNTCGTATSIAVANALATGIIIAIVVGVLLFIVLPIVLIILICVCGVAICGANRKRPQVIIMQSSQAYPNSNPAAMSSSAYPPNFPSKV